MHGVTLYQLQCLDAVITEGSFQAAAAKLHRTHPTVCTAVKNLEAQVGFCLLDRSGYRVALTDAGETFHRRAKVLLRELADLRQFTKQVAKGEEAEFRVVLGDLCPLRETLAVLRHFFQDAVNTYLHLHFEAISGPQERLFDDDADLIFHHVDKADLRLEFIELGTVRLVPVLAPDFVSFPITDSITPDDMKPYTQCIIRDTARRGPARDYYVVPGARALTVRDQFVKREVILQGLAWGHMPVNLITEDLRCGRLVSIAGTYLRGGSVDLVAARRRGGRHGQVANRLWRYLEAVSAAAFSSLMDHPMAPEALLSNL
jgi:DNA-binding transcriptional LysR family regulator